MQLPLLSGKAGAELPRSTDGPTKIKSFHKLSNARND
jgi:hypothetical protein